MFFKTVAECSELARALGYDADPKANRLRTKSSLNAVRINFQDRKLNTYAFARRIASWMAPFRYCLLWVTEFGVWPSSENLHLYYKLRFSYDDHRQLFDAPGHLFLDYEESDLATFVDLAVQFGWGGFLLKHPQTSHLTLSHDEWALFESEGTLDGVIEDIEGLKLPFKKVK